MARVSSKFCTPNYYPVFIFHMEAAFLLISPSKLFGNLVFRSVILRCNLLFGQICMLACISSPYTPQSTSVIIIETMILTDLSYFKISNLLSEDLCISVLSSLFVIYFCFGFQDPSYIVRKSFICKLYGLLKKRAIPVRYACAFSLASTDCSGDVRAKVNDLFFFFSIFVSFLSIYMPYNRVCSRGFPVLFLVSKLLK